MQVGNGNFAEDVYNYKGKSWYVHGRLVQYDFGGAPEIEQWLTANLNRNCEALAQKACSGLTQTGPKRTQ
ncbi:hypothetical protein EV359DRAFT_85375 [Lentinula novae-zelandiae]|nr:hypothetical protein EV359DRAFT_85375 [Lentinula novae-zelandiae]